MPKKEIKYFYLRLLIASKYRTEKAFATALGKSPAFVYKFLNGGENFTAADIQRSISLLEIRQEEVGDYFFPDKYERNPRSYNYIKEILH